MTPAAGLLARGLTVAAAVLALVVTLGLTPPPRLPTTATPRAHRARWW